LKFTSTGRFLTSWGASFSVGAAIDGSGRVLVVETPRCFAFPWICIGDNRIEVFTNAGMYLTTWGTSGAGDGQFAFSSSSGIAVEQRGRILVADTRNNRIQELTDSGSFLTAWGTPGGGDAQFNSPSGVAVDASGNVFVVDTGNNRIQKFACP